MAIAEYFLSLVGIVIAAAFAVTTLGLLADMSRRLLREATVLVRSSRDARQPRDTQGVQRV